MLLEYLSKPTSLCIEDVNARPHTTNIQRQLPSSAPIRGYLCNDESSASGRRMSLSRRWGLFGPAARMFKGSVEMVSNTVYGRRDGSSTTEEDERKRKAKEERRQILELRMKNAENMEQWKTAAKELDVLEDNESWKFDAESCSEFDAPLIEQRLRQLDEARINCDVKAMLNIVRTCLSRDVGGMGNIRLYKHSHIGTKDLIERYIDSTMDTIRSLVETSKHSIPEGLEDKDILERVVYARQAFGRSALLLSGGATFGMNHIGVLKALFEAKLLPRIISGSSAGSIVCAVLCTRTDEEIPKVLGEFPYGDLSVFEEDGNEDGILLRLRRFLTQGAWIDIKHLSRVMREMLGDMTFQEAYNRTRRILNICVSSASVYELPRLLNYVTAPNVMIWSAVAASCSVPFVFSPGQLLVKNPATGENIPWNPTPQLWIDGSVDSDLPMNRLAEMFNVNHFIVSQVNPHVIPFLIKDDIAVTHEAQAEDEAPGWVYTLTNLAKDEALHRMQVLTELGIFPNLVSKARSVLSQKYSGDITILPAIDYKDFPRILKNPTADFMVQACLRGERATWPKLSRIRNHCAVELELDAAVQALRARVVFSPSQVDLRRMTTGSLTAPPRRVGRKRRDSGGNLNILQFSNTAESPRKRKSSSRPPLRSGQSSLWLGTKRHLTTSVPVRPRSEHGTPLTTSNPSETFKFPTLSNSYDLTLQIPEISSAGETSHSPPTSDADEDSHTEESSPEPEVGNNNDDDALSGLGLYYSPGIHGRNASTSLIDFFSNSQPITPRTDHILATSPSSVRGGANIGMVISPSSKVKPGENKNGSGGGAPAVVRPSTPELKYKKLFHPFSAGV